MAKGETVPTFLDAQMTFTGRLDTWAIAAAKMTVDHAVRMVHQDNKAELGLKKKKDGELEEFADKYPAFAAALVNYIALGFQAEHKKKG